MEATGLFLDECLHVCALIELGAKGKAEGPEMYRVVRAVPERNQRRHFPEKLAKLEKDFGIRPAWSDHVLSLNKARTCVTHRLGRVSKADVNEGEELVVTWRTTRMVVREIASGKERPLELGLFIEAESAVEISFVDHVRRFALGERIRLTHFELYSLVVTLWAFATSCAQDIERFARSKGLQITEQRRNEQSAPRATT